MLKATAASESECQSNSGRENMGLSDEELQEVYTWVDEIPLSRPKRSIARDFSDGGKDIIVQTYVIPGWFSFVVSIT